MKPWLLDVLRCPLHAEAGPLAGVGSGAGLSCRRCGTVYPVVDGIPTMLAPSSYPEWFRDRESRQWDEQAPTYEDRRGTDLVYLATVEAAVRSLAPHDGDLVLDAGCGTGMTLRAYRQPSVRVVALDLSLESLRRARATGARAEVAFVRGDLAALPFAPNAFAKVLCANALQNLPHDGLRQQSARELARVARPGARVVVSAHNLSVLKRRGGWKKEGASNGPSGRVQYIYRYEAAEFRELLASVLEVKAVRGAGFPLPYRWKLSGACWLVERVLARFDVCADWAHMLVGLCEKEASDCTPVEPRRLPPSGDRRGALPLPCPDFPRRTNSSA